MMANSAMKHNTTFLDEIAADLSAALAQGNFSVAEAIALADDLEDVMNSANLPESQVKKAIAGAQAILLASGVSPWDVHEIVKDLQTIAAAQRKRR